MPSDLQRRKSHNVLFTVHCPLGNTIELWEKTWKGHTIVKHDDQDLVGKLEHVQRTVQDPDHARRSTDANIGKDTCIYERVVTGTNQIMRVPVLFDSPNYEAGGLLGHVMTAFIPEPGSRGKVGEIFWTADRSKDIAK